MIFSLPSGKGIVPLPFNVPLYFFGIHSKSSESQVKIMGITMGIIVTVMVVVAVYLSIYSRQMSAPGVVNGRLVSCPVTPNCVCSEYPDSAGYVEPLVIKGDIAEAWNRAKAAARESGGRVVVEEETYFAATFTSLVFRFVDDLELRLDVAEKTIHLRSASRVGHSDLGVNRKRVERFRRYYLEQSSK